MIILGHKEQVIREEGRGKAEWEVSILDLLRDYWHHQRKQGRTKRKLAGGKVKRSAQAKWDGK